MQLSNSPSQYWVLLFIALINFSCNSPQQSTSEDLVDVPTPLWIDQTEIYLPITGEWTNRVEVADINQDGRVDLLFANGGDYSEPGALESSRIFLNQGPDTQFKEISQDVFGEDKYYARVIKVRDLNQDQIPDMVVGNTFQTQSQLFMGLGNGKFKNVTATQLPQMNASVGDIEFGDVDFDGDLDIILADWGPGNNMQNSGGRTMLWLNNGRGEFDDATSKQMPDLLVQFSWDLEFLDVDNDFDLDIVVSCKRCATGRLFVNDGKGNFTDKRALPAYTNNYEYEPLDLNADGFLDLLTINDGEIVDGISYSRREHVFLNDSGRRFNDVTVKNWPASENVGEDDNNIVYLDYDSDGDGDFIIGSLTGEDRLLANDGLANFKLIQPILSGKPTPHTLSLMLGDINNDHKMDIIMAQGEGDENIEERVFIGEDIMRDTAKPIIAQSQISAASGAGIKTIKVRIHDNKSPNMPQDWKKVYVLVKKDTLPLQWYGENLWSATMDSAHEADKIKICATDAAGNTACAALSGASLHD